MINRNVSMKKAWLFISLVFALILTQSGFGYAFQSGNNQRDIQQLKAFSNAFVEVAKKVTPAVVSIEANRKIRVRVFGFPSQPQRQREFDQFEDFFRSLFPRDYEQQEEYVKGIGSGVIIDKEGYILTNNHVIRDAEEIIVYLQDKRKYTAEVIGTDPLTEVALLKIDGSDLPTAKLGDSDNIQVGEWVIAVGTPLSQKLNYTVTAGIISAVGRRLDMISQEYQYVIEDFIQTDAAINPGNSGGPLVNLDGEIIGINTAIMSNTGSYQGYGFAIPINLVKNIAADLREHGKVVRGVLGVSFREIEDQEDMKKYKLSSPYGARITGFPDDSPGKRDGLKVDDVIIAIDGKPFKRGGQLQTRLAGQNPGDKVKVTVMRNGKRKDIWVTLGEMPEEEQPVITNTVSVPEIGIEVQEAEGAGRIRSDEPRGVVVINVRKNSEADKKLIKIGDIIYKIEKTEINSLKDFRNAIENYKDQELVTFYIRNEEGWNLINIRLKR